MKKFRVAALFLAAVLMLSSVTACKDKKKKENSANMIEVSQTTPDELIGSNKIPAKLYESVSVGDTVFTVNNVIDVNNITENGRYIYIDYTIENKSDKDFPTDAVNNFCININGEEVVYDVRADVYAKRFINGYSSKFTVEPKSTVTNYIGFVIPEDTKSFSVGYYATGSENDKTSIVLCDVSSSDFVAPPAGLIKESE